jgi:hypothetical protein
LAALDPQQRAAQIQHMRAMAAANAELNGEEFDSETGDGADMDDNVRNPKTKVEAKDQVVKLLETLPLENDYIFTPSDFTFSEATISNWVQVNMEIEEYLKLKYCIGKLSYHIKSN